MCIFCAIINKEKEAEFLAENDRMVVFKDIHPSAPVHLLIVPKKHITSVNELEESDARLIGDLVIQARDIAKEKNIDGYKLLFNVGRKGGQLVDHVHLHLLGGWN